ncbi:ABC transporter permease [Geotalea sp. SG265]|uniref:ABC transporter permease n=1 Tax=Geotalea sp. SG265 TaxID=2922867 RepID=UPI001FAF7CAF|nr:ABC transporter permease [Geotalea sp. SG265]
MEFPQSFRDHLLRSSGLTVFLLLWELAPRLEWIDPDFLPAFSTVMVEVCELFQEGALQIHLLVSIWRGVTGLLLALALGLPLGLVLGRYYRDLAETINPLLRVLSQVNPFTLLPVFILFFGIGETAKVAVVAWVCLWPVLFYTITASREVPLILVKTAVSMGASSEEMLLKVIVPAALPTIFVGIRIAACLTFYILVAAEMLGAGAGLGWLVHNSAMNYQIPRIYAGAAFIILLGFLLSRFLRYLERGLFPWQFEAMFQLSGEPAQLAWRPRKAASIAFACTVLVALVIGGFQVDKINRASAQGGHTGHHGHQTMAEDAPGGPAAGGHGSMHHGGTSVPSKGRGSDLDMSDMTMEEEH